MSRNRRSHYFGAEQSARIEIIPMIDVMMFLLVFFVLIMLEMIQGAGISLDLPQSSTAQSLESVQVNIGLAKNGLLYLEGAQISETALISSLKQRASRKKVDVVISGDKTVDYQTIIKTMDLVRATGISAIGLATRDE